MHMLNAYILNLIVNDILEPVSDIRKSDHKQQKKGFNFLHSCDRIKGEKV